MTARKLAILGSLSALTLAAGCSSTPPPSQPVGNSPGWNQNVAQYGYVSGIEAVPVASRTSGGGALLGGVVGAVIGNQIGHGSGRAAATGVGAVGGALIGDSMERRNRNDGEFYRVSVRFDHGNVGQFDYAQIDDLRVGDRVRAEGGQLYRN